MEDIELHVDIFIKTIKPVEKININLNEVLNESQLNNIIELIKNENWHESI